MAKFADLLHAGAGTHHAELIRERMLFSQIFKSHLAHERAEVISLASINTVLADKAKLRGSMIAELQADYSAHVRHWTPQHLITDWSGYRKAVLGLQARLRRFMLWEEENLPIYV